MTTCDNCGGEGGWEEPLPLPSKWADPTPGDEWIDCPECAGSGWVEGDPEPITQDELEDIFR